MVQIITATPLAFFSIAQQHIPTKIANFFPIDFIFDRHPATPIDVKRLTLAIYRLCQTTRAIKITDRLIVKRHHRASSAIDDTHMIFIFFCYVQVLADPPQSLVISWDYPFVRSRRSSGTA